MASRLRQSLALVEDELPDLNGRFRHGVLALANLDAPPRIVWVPTQDQYDVGDTGSTNPKALWTRWAGVGAHCWGKDEEVAEELFHQVAAKLKKAFGSRVGLPTPLTGRWVTQELQSAGYIKLGEVYVLSFSLGIQVYDEPFDLAKVTDIQHPPGVAGDGILTCDDP